MSVFYQALYQPFQPTLSQQGLEQHGLSLQLAKPCKPLNQVVYRYLQISIKQASPYPVMPDGTQALYFSKEGVLLGGAFDHVQTMQLMAPGDYFGIWFYPAGLRHFSKFDLAEIQNQFIDESFIANLRLSSLQQQLYQEQAFIKRIAICEAHLLSQFSLIKVTKFDHALSLALQNRGNARVQSLSEQVGWSSRHLNRMFLQHTGLSTKSFSQIIRLQSACKALALNAQKSVDIALDSGYFDQAHFIHSVKKHLGQSA